MLDNERNEFSENLIVCLAIIVLIIIIIYKNLLK